METQQSEQPSFPQSTNEHRWLDRFVGEWDSKSTFNCPDSAGAVSEGHESVRQLGDFWVVAEAEFDVPGMGKGGYIMILGYDPAMGRYVGTWVGSMMGHIWSYEGELEGNTLTLLSTGPAMDNSGGTAEYKDVTEFKSNDERELTSWVKAADGDWQPMMQATYYRVR